MQLNLKINTNASASCKSDRKNPPPYTPLPVIDFPLLNAKWCCKCKSGPPSTISDDIFECGICDEKIWGHRSCLHKDKLSKVKTVHDLDACYDCGRKIALVDAECSPIDDDTEDSNPNPFDIEYQDSDRKPTRFQTPPQTPSSADDLSENESDSHQHPDECTENGMQSQSEQDDEKLQYEIKHFPKPIILKQSEEHKEESPQSSQSSHPLQPVPEYEEYKEVSPQSQSLPPSQQGQVNVSNGKYSNTVIMLDFDDTLFPTTKLNEIMRRPNAVNNSLGLVSKMTAIECQQFINLSHVTFGFLTLLVKKYSKRNICIVSAACPGWVKHVLSMVYNIGAYKHIYHLLFIRNLKDIDDNISIYHPSSKEYLIIADQTGNMKKYKDLSEHAVTRWKYKTFVKALSEKISGNFVNTFVIIGDLEFEYSAAKKLKETVDHVYGEKDKYIFIHRVKLQFSPTTDTLGTEHNVLFQLITNQSFERCSLVNKRDVDFDYKLGKFLACE